MSRAGGPLLLSLSLTTQATSQTLDVTVKTAEIAGVELRNLTARVQARPAKAILSQQQSAHRTTPNQAGSVSADLSVQWVNNPLGPQPIEVRVAALMSEHGWQLHLKPLQVPTVTTLGPWQARLNVSAEIFGMQTNRIDELRVRADVADLQYADAEGRVAVEEVDFEVDLLWQGSNYQRVMPDRNHFSVDLRSAQGAMLVGPVFVDFAAHPLRTRLDGHFHSLTPLHVELNTIEFSQQNLLMAKGTMQSHLHGPKDTNLATAIASVITNPQLQIDVADIELTSLQFPAAYQSFLRTALAGSLLGNLDTRGEITGVARVRNNIFENATISLNELYMLDRRTGALQIDELSGQLNWRAKGSENPNISRIGWKYAALNGIPAQATQLSLLLQDDEIELIKPGRIPILDGALRVETFRVSNFATPDREIFFDGFLEPVSLSTLTRSLGWPQFGGTLTGRAPGVQYRDGRLTLSGAVEAEVFGGRITGRDLIIDQPFSRWPRLTVDITLDNLDLSLLTSTFDIGAISGRIGGQVSDLELFGWQPVAFDASIATVDESPEARRISVRAINSIANIGGTAGSGVGAALQGTLLRFFDSYRYRRLGFRCTLRDDVCWMSGTGPNSQRFGDRYVLLEGAGLPRLEIVGYSGRIKWSQLVEQISAQIQSGAAPVRAP